MGFTSHDWSEETLDWPRHVESETEWVQVVNEFISRCEDLYKTSEAAPSPVLPPSPPSFPFPSPAPLPAPKPSFRSRVEAIMRRYPTLGYSGRARSRASSRGSSRSEGHVSPEDDGPSKKVVHYDD